MRSVVGMVGMRLKEEMMEVIEDTWTVRQVIWLNRCHCSNTIEPANLISKRTFAPHESNVY
jgi:hypothetical protein